jgi:hypothetical protein
MFQLIVGIIAIGLFAAITAASIYYGGDVWTEGAVKADAATVMSQSEQIHAAFQLYKAATGSYPSGQLNVPLDALVAAGYLKAVPVLPAGVVDPAATNQSWGVFAITTTSAPDEYYLTYGAALNTSSAERQASAEKLCLAIMERFGMTSIPTRPDAATLMSSYLPSGYGCIKSGNGSITFRRKMY